MFLSNAEVLVLLYLVQLIITHLGAVFTITTSVQIVAVMISTVVLNSLYRPESLINGHIVDTGIVFWIMAGFWALSIPLIV